MVTIKVETANFTASPGATDPVESYSDAGASSGNTMAFRWVTVVDGTTQDKTYALLTPTK